MARLKVVGGDADLFSYAALSREDEVAAKRYTCISNLQKHL